MTEYALMIEREGGRLEFIPAKDATNAENIARTHYPAYRTRIVERTAQPWRYWQTEVQAGPLA